MTAFSIGIEIDNNLCRIQQALTVLDAAIDRADSCEAAKADDGASALWKREIAYIDNLIYAAVTLMQEPMENLKTAMEAACKLDVK